MHTNVMHDNAIALMIHHCLEAAIVALLIVQSNNRATRLVYPELQTRPSAASGGILMHRGVCQYALRRTTAPRGATTAPPGRTTGALTTAAPPAATQPARTTPRAQTTAPASTVLRAMRL